VKTQKAILETRSLDAAGVPALISLPRSGAKPRSGKVTSQVAASFRVSERDLSRARDCVTARNNASRFARFGVGISLTRRETTSWRELELIL